MNNQSPSGRKRNSRTEASQSNSNVSGSQGMSSFHLDLNEILIMRKLIVLIHHLLDLSGEINKK